MIRKLAEGILVHDGAPMMLWCVGNAKVEPRGNALLITKQTSGTAKIDPLVQSIEAAPEGVRVVLDMQGLFALDTTGLDALQDVFKAVRLRGGTLELHAPQAVVASLLQRSGFADELAAQTAPGSAATPPHA